MTDNIVEELARNVEELAKIIEHELGCPVTGN